MYFLNFAANETDDFTFAINETTNELPPLPYQTNCGQYDMDNSPGSNVNTCEKNCPASDHPSPEVGCRCINVLPMATEADFMEDSSPASELESIVIWFSVRCKVDQATQYTCMVTPSKLCTLDMALTKTMGA